MGVGRRSRSRPRRPGSWRAGHSGCHAPLGRNRLRARQLPHNPHYHIFIRAVLEGREISVYGDGKQTRDFTYVADAADATARAGYCEASGEALNIGGGSRVALIDVIHLIGDIMGVQPKVRFQEQQKGDVRDTAANTDLARRLLDYRPQVSLREGLEREVEYVRKLMGRLPH
jgi:nucleoside-diphosphate-sugar epimerase